jgi:hypothetical protein
MSRDQQMKDINPPFDAWRIIDKITSYSARQKSRRISPGRQLSQSGHFGNRESRALKVTILFTIYHAEIYRERAKHWSTQPFD